MAFDFLDMFPDSQAAVEGAKGAQNIINDQYKGAMGFMEMENALTRAVNARRQLDEEMRVDPLRKTVDAIKLLQGLNLENSGDVFAGANPMDIGSINDALLKALPNLKTNYEADIAKSKAAASETYARAAMLEQGRNSRDAAGDREKQEGDIRKGAQEFLKTLTSRYQKTPTNERKARQLVADYQALKAYGVPEVARVFFNNHAAILGAAGESAPGAASNKGAVPSQPPAAKNPAAAQPKTYTSKSGKQYLIYPDGRIVGQ